MRTRTPTFLLLILSFFASGQIRGGPACEADAETLCLQGDRFAVRVNWRDFEGNPFSIPSAELSGAARVVTLSDDAGYFWFPNEREQRNVDILMKVLDGCPITNHFWVFAAAPTNREVTLEVTDTATGQIRQYFNPQGIPFSSITDTSAFETCSENPSSVATKSASEGPQIGERSVISDFRPDLEPPVRSGISAPCSPGETVLCLLSDRFRVEVEWRDFASDLGAGTVVPVAETSESGIFRFFGENNIELAVQILDGRTLDGHFWVFSAATTDVEYTIRVTDTETARQRTYTNSLGQSSAARLDNRAFARTEPLIFPQTVVGPLGDGSTFDVELGLANPNAENAQTLEIMMLDQNLRNAAGIEFTTIADDGVEEEPTVGPLILELAPQQGITTLIRIADEQEESQGFVQGFLVVSSIGPAAGNGALRAPISSFSYSLRNGQGGIIDRIPVAATINGDLFQFTATKRESVDTGIAIATPLGVASVEVEVFLPPDGAGTGGTPDSLVESFELSGQSSFFLGELFGTRLPTQFESLLVQIRSTPVESIATRGTTLSPIAVTSLDVVAPPQSTTVQIAGKEVRRISGN